MPLLDIAPTDLIDIAVVGLLLWGLVIWTRRVHARMALIGLACAGHQGFSANLYALPGDVFPRWMAGSVVGLGGLAGAIGGMLMAKFAGVILERIGSYGPIFAVASCAYLVALLTIHLIIPRYQVVASAGTVDQGA